MTRGKPCFYPLERWPSYLYTLITKTRIKVAQFAAYIWEKPQFLTSIYSQMPRLFHLLKQKCRYPWNAIITKHGMKTVVCSTDRSKAVVPVLVLLFVALWFILRGDLLYVFPCVILFLCFSVLLVLRLPRLGKRELILVLFVRLFGLCLFRFVGFLFLLGSGKGCGLWLWHSLDFSFTFFLCYHSLRFRFYW